MTGHENELKASAEMKKYAVNIDSSSNKQNDKDQVKEEQRVKKRKYLESGCGGGKKKHKIVDSFYNTLWPILEEAGWSLVNGAGKNEGAVYFLPPGVTQEEINADEGTSVEGPDDSSVDDKPSSRKSSSSNIYKGEWKCNTCGIQIVDKARCKKCMGWKGGRKLQKAYLSRVRDVIERVLDSKEEAEAKAAEAYVQLVPDIREQLQSKKKDLSAASDSVITQSEHQEHVNLDWKHERTHYPKATSRVGEEFQVSELPKAGSHTIDEQNDIYEQVWDWKRAEASGKHEFCARVTPNKKAEAYIQLQQRGFVLPGFYNDVCSIPRTDGSDWTEDDKKRFRALIFKEQKSIINVSKALGKPMKECMGYYYGTFKKSKDYPRLKLAIYRNKERAVKTRSSNWICDTCGIGGKLIACDSCDLHFHLDCLDPPLKHVPEGTWICSSCAAKTDENEGAPSVPNASSAMTATDASASSSLSKVHSATLKYIQCPTMGCKEEGVYSNQGIASIKNNDVKVKVIFGESTTGSENKDFDIKRVDSDMYESEVH